MGYRRRMCPRDEGGLGERGVKNKEEGRRKRHKEQGRGEE
jgi:hypothetical protein